MVSNIFPDLSIIIWSLLQLPSPGDIQLKIMTFCGICFPPHSWQHPWGHRHFHSNIRCLAVKRGASIQSCTVRSQLICIHWITQINSLTVHEWSGSYLVQGQSFDLEVTLQCGLLLTSRYLNTRGHIDVVMRQIKAGQIPGRLRGFEFCWFSERWFKSSNFYLGSWS